MILWRLEARAGSTGATMGRSAHFLVCLALFGSPAFAQGVAVPNLAFDNFHLLTPDPAKAREWYIEHLGATAAPTAGMAYFGKTLVVFLKNDRAQPSAGSAIDHVAFSVADVDAKMSELVGDARPYQTCDSQFSKLRAVCASRSFNARSPSE
jgi:hypothetical protein